MAIVKIIDSSQFNPVEYKDGDERTILPIPVNSTFTTENGRVESLVYDLQGNLLNYNPNARYGIIENGAGGDIELADKLDLYPEEEVTNLGIDVGFYNVYYNILNNELNSSIETPFSLKQISADRKELRLTTSFLTEDDLEEEVGKISPDELISPYYPDFYLNFGQNRISIVTNIIFDGSNNQFSILVKLYEPLPSFANESDACWLTSKQRDSIAYEVEIEAPPSLPTPRKNVLRGPNFSLPLNNEIHSTTKLTSLQELQNLSGITTASRRQLDSILSGNGVEINVDYTDYNNFVHFSSAEERVNNFYKKVGLIEHLSGSIFESSGSGEFNSSSRFELENRISTTIDNFDGFEYFMYFTSQSYENLAYPRDYPKLNSTAPYTLASTGSSDGVAFLGKSVLSASLYDAENLDNAIYTIPEYLLEDPANEPYKKFVEMIGQHFDTLFVYAKDITNRYNADNRLDFGISKDLVGEAIKSMGINLYTGNFTSNNLVDSLVGTRVPATLPDGQINVSTYTTASNDVVPVEDVNKEIYKRIYHNLPLLLRQKGSLAGLRTLITCFGIPEEILKIREYNIANKSTIYDLPDVGTSASIAFSNEIASFPPERTGYIPPKFLSPIIRVQQDDSVQSESYDRSLHYTEVGYSPSTYIDETDHSAFNPLDSSFPSFSDFYFGSDMNYYGSKFVDFSSDTSVQDITWNLASFIRYIKFLDSSLFNMIKDFIPVRTSTATGVIIKPTIKERQRQRPAQLSRESFSVTNISGSALTEGYDFSTSQPIIRSIGDYTLRAGAAGLKALCAKDGAYQYPAGTGGSTDDLNRVRFSGETDWGLRDIRTPIDGITQSWSEPIFNIQSYSNPILGYPTASTAGFNGSFIISHTGQEELYNGIFQQIPNGIGNFDNYLEREFRNTAATGSITNGAGVIRTDNNPNNPYKAPVNNTFAGLVKANISNISGFLTATQDVLYSTQGDGIIYIKIGAATNLTEELLLGNGSTLTFNNGSGVIISYTVGTPTVVSNAAGNTYVAYYLLDNPTLNDDVFANSSLTSVTFIANWNPLSDPGTIGAAWAYNDFNPLIGNSFDPQAGLVNYAGIRKSKFFIDLDYSPSASSSINPINLPANISQSISASEASFAAVQDSNYNSKYWRSLRYDGVRNSSPDFNIPIIQATDNLSAIFTEEATGIDPNASGSAPTPPAEPADSFTVG